MSAPGKQSKADPEMYLGSNLHCDSSSANGRFTPVEKEGDGTSRFSSCTAKTSPSTDNNSNGYPAGPQDYWDASLQAKIG